MAPAPGDQGPRMTGMPRHQAAPEHNLVQNPAVARAVARFAGLKQAHVMPAFSEGLTAQLVVGDLRADPKSQFPRSYGTFKEAVPDGVNVDRQSFVNPTKNSTICVLRRLHLYSKVPITSEVVYTVVQSATVQGASATYSLGWSLTQSYVAGGIPPQTYDPPDTRNSACGIFLQRQDGITGQYLWEGFMGGSPNAELLEEFNGDRGPRIILWPGSNFNWYVLDSNANYYSNVWWDEYPLT